MQALACRQGLPEPSRSLFRRRSLRPPACHIVAARLSPGDRVLFGGLVQSILSLGPLAPAGGLFRPDAYGSPNCLCPVLVLSGISEPRAICSRALAATGSPYWPAFLERLPSGKTREQGRKCPHPLGDPHQPLLLLRALAAMPLAAIPIPHSHPCCRKGRGKLLREAVGVGVQAYLCCDAESDFNSDVPLWHFPP